MQAIHRLQQPDYSPPTTSPQPLTVSQTPLDFPSMSPEPLTPEYMQGFICNSAPDPSVEHTLREQTEAKLTDLRSQLKETEQNACDIKEQIQFLETILGPGKALIHDICGTYAPPASCDVADQFDSPGAITLVDSGLEESIPSPFKKEVLDIFPTPILDFQSRDAEDILLQDITTEQLDRGIHQTFAEIKKRKRSSRHVTSKKVCIEDKVQSEAMASLHSSGGHQIKHIKPRDVQFHGKSINRDQTDDGSQPPVTGRPTSWPRTRLFRRSAGVSVKKLTDAFEILGLKQRQS